MPAPPNARKIIFARDVDGRTEQVEWIRHADTVWLVAEGKETVIGPPDWKQAWEDLAARGFVEVYPNDRRRLDAEIKRVLDLIQAAFHGVSLGDGVGLRQAGALDDYEDAETIAACRAQDEKADWSAISAEDLDRYYSSPCFFDAEGMRFHLPAYMSADLRGVLGSADIIFNLVDFRIQGVSRFELLSTSQRQAVREFLLLRLSDADNGYDHAEIEEALAKYWTISMRADHASDE